MLALIVVAIAALAGGFLAIRKWWREFQTDDLEGGLIHYMITSLFSLHGLGLFLCLIAAMSLVEALQEFMGLSASHARLIGSLKVMILIATLALIYVLPDLHPRSSVPDGLKRKLLIGLGIPILVIAFEVLRTWMGL